MAYIDQAFFSTYSSTLIPEAQFPMLAERASDMIDIITSDQITASGGISSLNAVIQARVKKAVAAQLDMLWTLGGSAALADPQAGTVTSESLGKYNYSTQKAPGQGVDMLQGVAIAPLVRGYLRPTGLLFQGIQPYAYDDIPLENAVHLE